MTVSRIHVLALAALALCTAAPAMAQEQTPQTNVSKTKVSVSGGYNYSSGDYGQTVDTQITYVPATVKAKYEGWTGKLTVPYISITGPGVVIGGEDTSTVGAAGAKATQSGLGDITASLGYSTKLGDIKGLSGSLTGKVKIPTADEDKNLGTGNTDFTLQAGLTKVYGDAYLTGSVGRKFNGTSARFNLDDVWKYSAGAGYNFTPDTSAGVNYDYREASTSTGDNYSHAIAYVTHDITQDWAGQVYAGTGFTDAAPDFSTGVQLTYKFNLPGIGEDGGLE